MYKNNNQSIVAKWKNGFQTAELSLSDIKEVGGYSSYHMGSFIKQEVKTFCVYSKKSIKIFELDCGTENRASIMYEINREESLMWLQKVIRFVSFGHLHSNKSKLLAQIYAEDQLSWWQKAINFVSGGYFYRTTVEIDGKEFKYLGSYDGEPALLTYTQTVDQEKSNFTGIKYKNDWILYKKLPDIKESQENNIEDQPNNFVSGAFNPNIGFITVEGANPFDNRNVPEIQNDSCVINNPYNDIQ